MNHITESDYPITFREDDAKELGKCIKIHHSALLVGMKRVGINNFLRFFLNHKDIEKTYIKNGGNNLFVQIDLNDLIERDIFPFWILVLKRLVDTIENSKLPEKTKKEARKSFTESIQLKDLFFTVDNIRKIISAIASAGYYPALFLIRFDRIKDVVKPELITSFQSFSNVTQHKNSNIGTSFRPVHQLLPHLFTKPSPSPFFKTIYLKPANPHDTKIILKSYQKKYNMKFSDTTISNLVELSGGHVQYLHIAIMNLHSVNKRPKGKDELFNLLINDEEIRLMSEELFESLTKDEKGILLKIQSGTKISSEMKNKAKYLWDTGIVYEKGEKSIIFTPLFSHYLQKAQNNNNTKKDLTKKEFLLFTFLKEHEGNLCERDDIIHAVWPEQAEMGVSDWAIDRLIARVRAKLKIQESPYEIITVITRGYKLVKKE